MAHAALDGMPGLPIARQFTLRGANMAGETTLDPNDSISVREATSMSLSYSIASKPVVVHRADLFSTSAPPF